MQRTSSLSGPQDNAVILQYSGLIVSMMAFTVWSRTTSDENMCCIEHVKCSTLHTVTCVVFYPLERGAVSVFPSLNNGHFCAEAWTKMMLMKMHCLLSRQRTCQLCLVFQLLLLQPDLPNSSHFVSEKDQWSGWGSLSDRMLLQPQCCLQAPVSLWRMETSGCLSSPLLQRAPQCAWQDMRRYTLIVAAIVVKACEIKMNQ